MLPHRNRHANPGPNMDDVVKSGYLKKLKTMKRKFYVLRRETGPSSPARLEYYDNERKFRGGVPPKKPILLRNCFSINRKMDPKHHNVLALYMSEDSVSVAAESESELNEWLGFLHHHMHDAMAGQDGQAWKPYEHVWMVVVQPRSLGSSKNLAGDYRICLTYKSIALVKIGGDGQEKIEFPLSTVRRCGHTGSFFFLGLGRSAVTGAGDIWMLTEDAVIAENMHGIIKKVCEVISPSEVTPCYRAMHTPCNNSSLVDDPVSRERTKSMSNHPSVDSVCTHTGVGTWSERSHVRERCGSMPSRGRTSSEGSNHKHQPHHHICHHHNCDGGGGGGVVGLCAVCAVTTSSSSTTSTVASFCPHVTRPQSMYSSSLSSSCSPPFASALFSPSSSESMESTTSGDDIDGHLPITPENLADDVDEDNYLAMDPMGGEGGGGSSSVGSHQHHHHHCYHCFHQQQQQQQHHHHPPPPCSLPIINTHSLASPHAKGLISPVSPGSSTDGPPCLSSPQDQYMNMYSPSEGRGVYGAEGSLDRRLGSLERGGYLMMDRTTPNPPLTTTTTTSTTTTSDTLGYLAMCPSLNSPGSLHPTWPPHPSSQVSPHSGRLASVVDEGGDNYLSMIPGGGGGGGGGGGDGAGRDGGYLDMTPTPTVPTPIPHSPSDGDSFPEMSPGSSCSFTSGTPSSDHRFPDFIAEKCGTIGGGGGGGNESYGCSEDDDSSLDRPIRTNSVGSKPEQYRSRKNSAPILGTSPISNSWSGTPGTFFRGFLQARSQERNDDLMEFDFSKNKSCDSISADKEKKSSSFESIKRTFKRSSSKSSGNGKFSVPDSMKRDKKKSESELSNKSLDFNYYEVEINPSPRRKTSESYEGYLPMRPAINTCQPISASDYLDMTTHDAPSRQGNYMDMRTGVERLGGSSCSVGSSEGYVDMSEGKGLGPLPINQSSGSSTSSIPGSSFPNGAKVRKFSPTFNALSSHDDQYMSVDLRSNIDPPHSHEGEKNKKKEKRSIRRKSLKDSTRRKKSEPISMIGKSDGDNLHEVSKKGTSPLSSLSFSSLLGRKSSTSTPPPKTPLSPTGSPLPKSTRGTPSPFSSLQRNKNRDDKDGRKDSISKDSGMTSSLSSIGTGCIEEASREAEESAMSAILGNALSATHPSQVPNDLNSKNTPGSKRASAIYEVPQTSIKEEESRTGSEVSNQSSSHQGDGEHGAYVNLTPASCDKTASAEKQRKLSNVSNVSVSLDYMNISPISSSKVSENEGSQSREYVNMCPGGRAESSHSNLLTPKSSSSPRTPSPCDPSRQRKDSASSVSSQPGKDPVTQSSGQNTPKHQRHRNSRRFSDQENIETGGDEESGYLLMTPGQPASSTRPLSPQTVTRRPDIPTSLLPSNSKDSTSPDPTLMATLERLNLGGNNERCRSHSGPGAPEGSAVGGEGRVKKQLSEPRGGTGSGVGTGRAASACSSPVSHSPPTSPTLGGSVSSVSSLSEGGLSSASSTCTVVNMGLVRREGSQSGSTRLQETTTTSAETSTHSTVISNQSPANTGTTSSGGGASSSSSVASSSGGGGGGGGGGSRSGSDVGLNYVALDLGVAKIPGVRPSPRMARKTPPAQPTTTATTTTTTTATSSASASVPQDSGEEEDEEPLSYAQIDFTKSEGLRTTTLTRDHRH